MLRHQGAHTWSDDLPEYPKRSFWVRACNYSLTTNDGNVAAGQTLTVDDSAISGSKTLTFNGAAETDGSFNLIAGSGAVSFTGGGSDDIFQMGANPDNCRQAQSAARATTPAVTLNGDYSAGLTLGTMTILNVETISMAGGHSYNLTSNDATVAAGKTLDGRWYGSFRSGDSLTFNGSAETNGSFVFLGGPGAPTISPAARAATLSISVRHSRAGDTLVGGAGNDTLSLNGDYSGLTLGAGELTGIETIALAAGHNYNLTENNGNVAAGQDTDRRCIRAGRERYRGLQRQRRDRWQLCLQGRRGNRHLHRRGRVRHLRDGRGPHLR